MSNELLNRAWEAKTESSVNKIVLCFLADKANKKKDNTTWYSIGKIEKVCHLSRSTVKASLRRLKELGHITWVSGKGRHKSNHYRVHPVVIESEIEPEEQTEEAFNRATGDPLDDSMGRETEFNGPPVDHAIGQLTSVNRATGDHLTVLNPKENPNLTHSPSTPESKAAPIETAVASSHSTPPPADDDEEDEVEETPDETKERCFDLFWFRYPAHRRPSNSKAETKTIFMDTVNADELKQVGKSLERWKESESWRKDEGKYVPNILKFFEGQNWRTPPPTITFYPLHPDRGGSV